MALELDFAISPELCLDMELFLSVDLVLLTWAIVHKALLIPLLDSVGDTRASSITVIEMTTVRLVT